MRPSLLAPLLLAALLLPRPAHADLNPLFLGLGGLKTPGIAFDIVGASMIRPHIGSFEPGSRMDRASRAAFTSHLVTLGLHSVSIGAFLAGGLAGDDWKEAVAPVLLVNAGCDLAIGVMGVTTGLDILFSKSTVDIKGTPRGIGATWSGIVNIGMGTFGLLWFTPMLIGGVVGLSELAAIPPDSAHIALRLRPPPLRVRVAPSGGGVLVLGSF